VERWSLANAALVLSASVAGLALGATWPVVLAGGAGLLGLVVLARKLWTPAGLFGRANSVTAGRLLLVLALPLLPLDASPAWPIAAGLVVLLADGLDGWLARRYEMTSEFGEFFDKETDALFLLVLCFMTASRGLLTPWVVGLGLLRYAFVFALFLLQPHVSKEYRSSWARVIYVVAILSLLTAFLPYPALVQPIVAAAAGALLYSFGRYLWWVLSVRDV
jgi:phosphatidylglycerophosphate synthase